jgi:Ca2+-transporting ATPase
VGVDDTLSLLNLFSVVITIIIFAVPKGLSLAATLSLPFVMKKLMQERAIVRQLSACETMRSASGIWTDTTDTITTNHVVVEKVNAPCAATTMSTTKDFEEFKSTTLWEVFAKLLLEGIF